VVVAAVLAVAAAAGCSQSPDRLKTTDAEAKITTVVGKDLLIEATSASCPKSIQLEKGAAFQCNVTVDGKTLPVKATIVDDKGDLRIEPLAAVVRIGQVQADLLDRLTKQFGRPFTADCGPAETRILKEGATFTCQASDATSKRVVTVKVKDANGTITYDVGGGNAPTTTTTAPGEISPTSAPATMVPMTTAPSTTAAPTTKPGTAPTTRP
jgi:hypothetical protein